MKKKETLIFIILLIGMMIFPYIPLELFNINYSKMNSTMKILYNLSCDIGFMIIVFMLYYKDIFKDIKGYIRNIKENLKLSFKYYFIGLVIMFLSNILIGLLFSNANANNEDAVRQMIDIYPIYMIFSVSIYAPFVEELIFRKSIREIFTKDNNVVKYTYIITSGFIFAFMHMISNINNYLDYLYIIPYMGVGCMFAIIYYKSNNIINTMVMHSLHNTISIILYLMLGV